MPENKHEEEEYVKTWQGVVDHVRLGGGISESFAGYKRDEKSLPIRTNTCRNLWQKMTILWNGDVTMCCEDVDGDWILGNLNEQSISEIWNRDKMLAIKRAHKHVLPSRRTIPVKAALKIMVSVLDALEYAHGQDIIHRDIKPGNILIEGHTGRPIIMDFGVAQVTKNSEEDSSMIVGTPIYMAPEQITNPEVDGRADLYSTAMMLLQMLIPAPLFSGIQSAKKLMEMKLERKDDLIPEMPSRLNKGVNQEMDRILSKALSFSPETRYTRCQDFRKQLTSYMDRYLTN